MIKVNFKIKELDDQIEIIYSFLSCKNEMSYTVANYFDLNLDGLLELASEKKQKVVSNAVSSKYNENLETMQKAVKKFQEFWNKKQNFINKELFKIFGREFNFNCIAYVNLNPVWPRYLKEKAFDVNYNASKDFLLSSCEHEIIHFIWFDIWKENFKNYKEDDFEYPNLVWLCSEIAVEPIFRFSKLIELSKDNPAYDYFYAEKIGLKSVAEIANEIYKSSKDINEFQSKLYTFFESIDVGRLIR